MVYGRYISHLLTGGDNASVLSLMATDSDFPPKYICRRVFPVIPALNQIFHVTLITWIQWVEITGVDTTGLYYI